MSLIFWTLVVLVFAYATYRLLTSQWPKGRPR